MGLGDLRSDLLPEGMAGHVLLGAMVLGLADAFRLRLAFFGAELLPGHLQAILFFDFFPAEVLFLVLFATVLVVFAARFGFTAANGQLPPASLGFFAIGLDFFSTGLAFFAAGLDFFLAFLSFLAVFLGKLFRFTEFCTRPRPLALKGQAHGPLTLLTFFRGLLDFRLILAPGAELELRLLFRFKVFFCPDTFGPEHFEPLLRLAVERDLDFRGLVGRTDLRALCVCTGLSTRSRHCESLPSSAVTSSAVALAALVMRNA